MSAKEDVFVEHELRARLCDLLVEYEKDVSHIEKNNTEWLWPRMKETLRVDYADDIIKEMNDVR